MRSIAVSFVVIVAAVVLVSCASSSSKELSRQQAAKMLRQSEVFHPVVWKIQEGTFCVILEPALDSDNTRFLLSQASPFEDLGLATISRGAGSCPLAGQRWVRIELTEKGRHISKFGKRSGNTLTFEISVPKKLEVTGISRDQDPSLLRVEYFLEYQPGQIVGTSEDSEPKRRTAVAVFKLYDDGWRVEDDGTSQFKVARQ